MRSPEPLLVLRWQLHPRPTGGRRFAGAYLVAGTGAVASTVIITLADWMSTSCEPNGFSCLGSYFRGILLGMLVGSAVVIALSIMLKLGIGYALALLPAVPVIGLLGFALTLTSLAALAVPSMIIFIALSPAGAAWVSSKIN